jgi:hypothetical protein
MCKINVTLNINANVNIQFFLVVLEFELKVSHLLGRLYHFNHNFYTKLTMSSIILIKTLPFKNLTSIKSLKEKNVKKKSK